MKTGTASATDQIVTELLTDEPAGAEQTYHHTHEFGLETKHSTTKLSPNSTSPYSQNSHPKDHQRLHKNMQHGL